MLILFFFYIFTSLLINIWYASLMMTILFIVQLIDIGVLNKYLGRTYLETKRRPRYIIKHKLKGNDK